jgi:hypothetical protein
MRPQAAPEKAVKMKTKLIVLFVLLSLALQACTLKVCQPTAIDYGTGKQLYSCKTYTQGTYQPVFTVYNMARQMTRK